MINNSHDAPSYVLSENISNLIYSGERKHAKAKSLISHDHVWDCPTHVQNSQRENDSCSHVAARVQNTCDPVTYNHPIAGKQRVGCTSMKEGRGHGGLWETVSTASANIIRIQHTARKMQQMGSSLEWQLRGCCHTELQLACKNKVAPRGHGQPPTSYTLYLSCPLSGLCLPPSRDPNITPIPLLAHFTLVSFLQHNSSILRNPPVPPSTHHKPSGRTFRLLMDTKGRRMKVEERPHTGLVEDDTISAEWSSCKKILRNNYI